MVTPAVKREAVAHVRSAFGLGGGAGVQDDRLCAHDGAVSLTPSGGDTELRERLRALAHERRRFGYRRLHVLLRREGFIVNHKRLFRIYREEWLMVRRRGGGKRGFGTRGPVLVSEWPDGRWAARFAAAPVIGGRRLRILVLVDDCTR